MMKPFIVLWTSYLKSAKGTAGCKRCLFHGVSLGGGFGWLLFKALDGPNGLFLDVRGFIKLCSSKNHKVKSLRTS